VREGLGEVEKPEFNNAKISQGEKMKTLTIAGLILTNIFFIVVSNVALKWSAASHGLRDFLWWQVVGNVAGFLGVLAFTFLLRLVPLYLAYAFTAGLGFVSVQVIGARLIFGEAITANQWLGIAFIASGVILVSLRR
jgi:multidrug transporter EmrE-like cation transporter